MAISGFRIFLLLALLCALSGATRYIIFSHMLSLSSSYLWLPSATRNDMTPRRSASSMNTFHLCPVHRCRHGDSFATSIVELKQPWLCFAVLEITRFSQKLLNVPPLGYELICISLTCFARSSFIAASLFTTYSGRDTRLCSCFVASFMAW
jgi:hypothetical protein